MEGNLMVRPQSFLSLDAQLFFWWDSLPPGRGVTMSEMCQILGVADPQMIRNSLVRLRKGIVRDPSSKGRLQPKPIRYNTADAKYYDLMHSTPNTVAAQIPGNILAETVKELLVRALTLENALGGLALSAQQYLDHDDLRALIAQLPTDIMWRVHDTFLRIAQARQLLALEEARRGQALPGNTNS